MGIAIVVLKGRLVVSRRLAMMTLLLSVFRISETRMTSLQASFTLWDGKLAIILDQARVREQVPGRSPEHFVFLFRQV